MQLLQWKMAQAQLVTREGDVLDLGLPEEFDFEEEKEEEDKVVQPPKSLTHVTGAIPCPVDSCPRTFTKRISLTRHWQGTHVQTTTLFHCPMKECTIKARRVLDVRRHLLHKHQQNQQQALQLTTKLNKSSEPNRGYMSPNGASLHPQSTQTKMTGAGMFRQGKENVKAKKLNNRNQDMTIEQLRARVAECMYQQERWREEERNVRRELLDAERRQWEDEKEELQKTIRRERDERRVIERQLRHERARISCDRLERLQHTTITCRDDRRQHKISKFLR